MRGVKLDLAGKRFGKLVVLGKSPDRNHGYAVWFVRCDCGVETTLTTNSLCRKNKPAKSCGCLWKKPLGESARYRALKGYKRNASTRGMVWELTDEQVFTLFKSACHYCGRPPANISSSKDSNGAYIYNGIDRRDNDLGYVEENVISCCKICNWAKSKMPYNDFMLWVDDLVRYQAQKQTSNPLVRGQSAA